MSEPQNRRPLLAALPSRQRPLPKAITVYTIASCVSAAPKSPMSDSTDTCGLTQLTVVHLQGWSACEGLIRTRGAQRTTLARPWLLQVLEGASLRP